MPYHSIPRPALDELTVLRASEVAKSENRTLANAIKQLVQEAWQARIKARLEAPRA